MRAAAKYIWWILVLAFIGVFVFAQTSGLTGRAPVTRGTAVGTVNGQAITFDEYDRAQRALTQQQQQRSDQPITLDDQRRIDDAAFNQLVDEMLMRDELRRRGIEVTDAEIREAAQSFPPPELQQLPELQTDGRFDMEKYQRYLRSPGARQSGLLLYLENYYRSEIPRAKLREQLQAGVFVSDAQLWSIWQDEHDSAQVSYVSLAPEMIPEASVQVSDAEVQKYYDEHKKEYGDERPGRAVLSLIRLDRPVTAADSQAIRQHALELRNEIVGGGKFEDVAKRESADTVSGAQGGLIGNVTKESPYVAEFKNAALALKAGELSQPVLSQFGYHLIKIDARKGDTAVVRHILLKIQQSDSTAAATGRRADDLAKMAAEADRPARFDSAARVMGLPVGHVIAIEGQPLTYAGRYVPDASAWAFGGAKPNETSQLIEAEDAYYVARLDSLSAGGKPTLDALRDEIRRTVSRQKRIAQLVPRAQKVASAVAGGSTLEQAAAAEGLTVQRSPMFTRAEPVPGLGRFNEAIGAAFGLPVGSVSQPIETRSGVYVIRVDRRTTSDRALFEAQKEQQREGITNQLRDMRVRQFLSNLRESAKVKDNRREIRERTRQPSAS